jgi:ATP-dependent DNA helicase RecG|tara:strand:- start:714 stop:2108 length:1395 start_codon:yes stop_codon:yes gene_type:complete
LEADLITRRTISSDDAERILQLSENHFLDVKSIDVTPAKTSKAISAFANAGGGELFIGIDENKKHELPARSWRGFSNEESANGFFQVFEKLDPLGNSFFYEFLHSDSNPGLLLHLVVNKTQSIIKSSDGRTYIRKNAQSLPVNDEQITRLKLDKGINSYEDEVLNLSFDVISNSETTIEFLLDAIPTAEPEDWLKKQFLVSSSKPTVAGILLFSDNPQAILPKRSAVKILRYQTKADAERDFLVGDPETIEGPIYHLIYNSVDRVREIIEGIEKIGPSGMERVRYPQEALHELLTNAVLHRDYSIAADVQVRIFDNRVEIESPGKLPGHVTVENIVKTQFARNPKIVRIVNKFKNPPNKDVGEGINTAFEAMEKLRLKKPIFDELDGSVLVTLSHESLASPEQIVMEYLKESDEITNQIARELTGIKSENTMKNVFYRLRDRGELEQSPKVPGKKHSWRKAKPS